MGRYSIGIDLGGTKILTSVIDKETGDVINSVKKKTKKEKGSEKIVRKIISSINEVIDESSISHHDIENIGLGAAGQIDREQGIIINAPNLELIDIPIKNIIEKEFNKNVFLGNDVEIATIGEMFFGAGKNENDFVCVYVGTGVGSCIVQNGKIRYGVSGTAGEIGHITVAYNGRLCGCGASGCLEAYASRLAIEKRILGELKKGKKSDIENYIKQDKPIKSGMIKKAIECDDILVTHIINEAASYLASGISSIINFYNPSLIILGGGLINAVDYFYDKTVEYAKQQALQISTDKTIFKKSKLGDYSGVIGAAMLCEYRK